MKVGVPRFEIETSDVEAKPLVLLRLHFFLLVTPAVLFLNFMVRTRVLWASIVSPDTDM